MREKVGNDDRVTKKVEARPSCGRDVTERHTFHIVSRHVYGVTPLRDLDRYTVLQSGGFAG